MRYWSMMLFLFAAILFTHPPRVGSGRMNRETVTVFYDTDSVDALYWKRKSDSLNKIKR